MRKALVLSIATLLLGPLTMLNAAEWGDLSGTFLYDGPAPKSSPLTITKDQEVCGKHKLVDESLVVGPQGGLANVVIFLAPASGDPALTVHESYAKSAMDEVTLDNNMCRFVPRVTLLRTSQTLVVVNSDPVGHNTKIDTLNNSPINPILPGNSRLNQKFPIEERLPSSVSCSIHPWMTAWVVIKDHPYFAVSDESGKFEIKNLPAGEWTFQIWQEKAGYLRSVKQNGKPTEWARGRVTLTIKPGTNDLGEIKVSPAAFQR